MVRRVRRSHRPMRLRVPTLSVLRFADPPLLRGSMKRRAGHGLSSLVVGVCSLSATTALASHPPRMPEVRAVIAKESEPNTVVLATRYGGHYFTRDGGATWFNVCH